MRREITLQNGDRIIVWADHAKAAVTVRHIPDDGYKISTITFDVMAAGRFNVAFMAALYSLMQGEMTS